jgi:hypothetical protein
MEHSARFLQLVESVRAHIVEVTLVEAAQLAEAAQLSERDGVPLHWIDVREDHEWAAGHVPGATHLGKGILICREQSVQAAKTGEQAARKVNRRLPPHPHS